MVSVPGSSFVHQMSESSAMTLMESQPASSALNSSIGQWPGTLDPKLLGPLFTHNPSTSVAAPSLPPETVSQALFPATSQVPPLFQLTQPGLSPWSMVPSPEPSEATVLSALQSIQFKLQVQEQAVEYQSLEQQNQFLIGNLLTAQQRIHDLQTEVALLTQAVEKIDAAQRFREQEARLREQALQQRHAQLTASNMESELAIQQLEENLVKVRKHHKELNYNNIMLSLGFPPSNGSSGSPGKKPRAGNSSYANRKCYNCGQKGHRACDCPNPRTRPDTSAGNSPSGGNSPTAGNSPSCGNSPTAGTLPCSPDKKFSPSSRDPACSPGTTLRQPLSPEKSHFSSSPDHMHTPFSHEKKSSSSSQEIEKKFSSSSPDTGKKSSSSSAENEIKFSSSSLPHEKKSSPSSDGVSHAPSVAAHGSKSPNLPGSPVKAPTTPPQAVAVPTTPGPSARYSAESLPLAQPAQSHSSPKAQHVSAQHTSTQHASPHYTSPQHAAPQHASPQHASSHYHHSPQSHYTKRASSTPAMEAKGYPTKSSKGSPSKHAAAAAAAAALRSDMSRAKHLLAPSQVGNKDASGVSQSTGVSPPMTPPATWKTVGGNSPLTPLTPSPVAPVYRPTVRPNVARCLP